MSKELFDSWVAKESKVESNGKRKYLHFDPKIKFSKSKDSIKKFLLNPEKIASHDFYPFIKSDIETLRYKKTENKDEKGKNIRVLDVKKRPIAYAAHMDSFIYSWYSSILTSKYEEKLNKWGIHNCVIAYLEKDKSNIEFADEVFQFIKSKGKCVALAFDISSFFDGLDHEHLKKMWCKVLGKRRLPVDHFKVFKSLTNYTTVEKGLLEVKFPNRFQGDPQSVRICYPHEFREIVRGGGLIKKNEFRNKIKESKRFNFLCGIPQGSPISACLSNIYMINFDRAINKCVSVNGGIYRRYCDDIIVVVDTDKMKVIRKRVLNEILKYELVINEDKTEITYFLLSNNVLRGFNDNDINTQRRNLQYLGFEFNGESAYIRSSSMSRYYRRMRARVRENLKAAYGKKSIGDKVFKKKLLNRYSIKGERNFVTYAERAADSMNSDSIRNQYKNSIDKVKKVLKEKKEKFVEKKKPKKKMD